MKVKPKGEALIIGDLHGDLESLIAIFKQSDFLQKMDKTEEAILVFLGDYGDRGKYSIEVYYIILRLKLLYPKQVILMRGNHEGPEDLGVSPHDLPWDFQTKFGEKWGEAYSKIRDLWACLYNAVLVEKRCLMVHGGLSPNIKTMKELAYAHETHPKQDFLEDLLWSDPNDFVKEYCASPRGAGKLFGENVTKEVLKRFNVQFLVRGHEPCPEGFKIDHNGKILTLFSRKGPPYFNTYGAFLDLNLSKDFENVNMLL
ncbi:MAG: metallophosphoesterase, partial [Desulfonauticus sp.]|nr:metallophosphoesterase [Desulfonauticus sp.]